MTEATMTSANRLLLDKALLWIQEQGQESDFLDWLASKGRG